MVCRVKPEVDPKDPIVRFYQALLDGKVEIRVKIKVKP